MKDENKNSFLPFFFAPVLALLTPGIFSLMQIEVAPYRKWPIIDGWLFSQKYEICIKTEDTISMQYKVVYKALRTRVFLFDDKKYPDPISDKPGKGLESVASIIMAGNGRKLEFR